jgi:hypothetical protein
MSFTRLTGNLTQLMQLVDDADRRPTTQIAAAAEQLLRTLDGLLARIR